MKENKKQTNLKPHKILVTETFKKEVVIYAYNDEEAFEKVDELVNKGYIDSVINYQDYSRELFNKITPTEQELQTLEVYDEFGNKIVIESEVK